SAAGPQLGRLGGDKALLRALSTLCDAAFQPGQRAAHRLLRMVRRQPRRFRRPAPSRGAGDVRQARSRAAGGTGTKGNGRDKPAAARPGGVVSPPPWTTI